MTENDLNDAPVSLDVISQYLTALESGDYAAMQGLRHADFVLDWVHADAFADSPLSHEETNQFWPVWLGAFSEIDYEVTRTIAGESVVVVQWAFTGTQDGPLGPPVFEPSLEPSGKTICLRGISVYDVAENSIQRETMYIDLATLWVELGVTP
ncbi:MAG: ester cyclase [Anaerolineales bacterium]|nr:ester cyclase [Chloroflexota bacterium]MBL6980109.1 ester cyclase [Anaerolineales bacterium]